MIIGFYAWYDSLSIILSLKYLITIISGILTIIVYGIFYNRQLENTRIKVILGLVLIFPFVIALSGLIYADIIMDYWSFLVGGSIFQLGTGVFLLTKDGSRSKWRYFTLLNYGLMVFYAVLICLKVPQLYEPLVIIVFGSYISMSSILVLFMKEKQHLNS
ncbi:MAG: hypothetical protein H3C31_11245 [Brumimicrobium sp.]|nr:hypothetical protein [Brumimicrobium sp.]